MSTVLSVNNLTKHYKQASVLRGVQFQVQVGEVVGLLGPNGAGKTTTLETIVGLTPADSGEITWFGQSVTWPLPVEIKNRIGVSFQASGLYADLTVAESIHLFSTLYPRHLPLQTVLNYVGLDQQADKRIKHLSGGQKQRVVLALSIINDPDVILLDEPTVGLDPANRRQLWDLIRQLKAESKTIILTSHYMDEIEQLCDRILFLNHGTIIADGTVEEIKQRLGAAQTSSLEDIIIELETT